MSCLPYLDGLWDRRKVTVWQLLPSALLPGLVQNSNHSFHLAFFPSILLELKWCTHTVILIQLQLGRIISKSSDFHLHVYVCVCVCMHVYVKLQYNSYYNALLNGLALWLPFFFFFLLFFYQEQLCPLFIPFIWLIEQSKIKFFWQN